MAIRTIEIICLPCGKCEQLKAMVINTIKSIELQGKTKIMYDLRITQSLLNVTNYGLSPAQTPVLLINGVVEAAGKIDQGVIRHKLVTIQKS